MIKRKPYLLFLLFDLILLFYLLFRSNNYSLDINIYDTYYVIREIDLIILNISFLSLLTFIYFLFDIIKVNMIFFLTNIHIYGTVFLLTLFYGFYIKMQMYNSDYKYYTITNYPTIEDIYIKLDIIIIVLLQFLFIINIFATLIKKIIRLKL